MVLVLVLKILAALSVCLLEHVKGSDTSAYVHISNMTVAMQSQKVEQIFSCHG